MRIKINEAVFNSIILSVLEIQIGIFDTHAPGASARQYRVTVWKCNKTPYWLQHTHYEWVTLSLSLSVLASVRHNMQAWPDMNCLQRILNLILSTRKVSYVLTCKYCLNRLNGVCLRAYRQPVFSDRALTYFVLTAPFVHRLTCARYAVPSCCE